VPKGTPKDIIAKLNGAVVEALADPTVRRRLADLANETVPRDQQTPAALAAWQKAENEKWWPIIKAAGHQRGIIRRLRSIGGRQDCQLLAGASEDDASLEGVAWCA
jgi:hypothetical protein